MYLHNSFSGSKNFKVWMVSCAILSFYCFVVLMAPKGSFLMNFSSDQSLFYVESQVMNTSAAFLLLVGLVSVSVFSWGYPYMSSKYNLTFFFLTLFLFVSSMMVLILSEGLILIFVGWEGLGVSSFGLILFYQNWMSCKGAVLTLLTNRLGDAILLICFCYWFLGQLSKVSFSGWSLSLMMVLVATTKSAQWPFISWLPAAMAAPTPVSALVHSSTLVTAGIWLMIRFSVTSLTNLLIWLYAGSVTLLVASFAAMAEKDSKKVVALSTLSQLGMLFMAMSTGNFYICLFHIMMHALAKANLFMVVGELLHSSFSQQDTRHVVGNSQNKFVKLSMMVSVSSLAGLIFSSGFFSKEQILMSQYALMSATTSWFFIFMVVGLTLSYCLKLFLSMSSSSISLVSLKASGGSLSPILALSMSSLFGGWVLVSNMDLYPIISSPSYGWYWILVAVGIFFLGLNNLHLMEQGVSLQNKIVDYLFVDSFSTLKKWSNKVESSVLEGLFISASLSTGVFFKQTFRSLMMISPIMMMLTLL